MITFKHLKTTAWSFSLGWKDDSGECKKEGSISEFHLRFILTIDEGVTRCCIIYALVSLFAGKLRRRGAGGAFGDETNHILHKSSLQDFLLAKLCKNFIFPIQFMQVSAEMEKKSFGRSRLRNGFCVWINLSKTAPWIRRLAVFISTRSEPNCDRLQCINFNKKKKQFHACRSTRLLNQEVYLNSRLVYVRHKVFQLTHIWTVLHARGWEKSAVWIWIWLICMTFV